ncbi:phage baseplate assembly protein V [Paenibacillus sp. JNUCC32]|uniref:phage baseplate assembly protein V n=1 Tax=Paenibacillus sp. JNUCC32 TaxID=2777984 RepID=UPI0017887967|nr:phage baseplate assembly protein V [Paenibacillus sp. JNUCC-32]QOT12954.1 phage baseplate assembly protein V [Paenibacillus sp. JNUCC-32]
MSVIENLIRIGLVSSVNAKKHTVRVVFEDKDNLVSGDLPVIVPYSASAKAYRLPEVSESVLCVFRGNGIQNGFCLGSYYTDEDVPPVSNKDQIGTWFEDGSYVFYDQASGSLHVKAAGNVRIEGDLTVTGSITSESLQTKSIMTDSITRAGEAL